MFNMDYAGLEAFYSDLTNLTNDMIEQIKNAKKIVDKMNNNDHWSGDGYENYQKKFSNLVSNFGSYCNEIYKLNNNIKTSVERVKNIDDSVMEQLGL